jgi:hypothetical protein
MSWVLLSSCGAKYTDRDFRLFLGMNMIEKAAKAKIAPPQFGWKTKCGSSKYLVAREPL